MKIKPEELSKEGYRLKARLPHDDIIPFLKESFNVTTTVIRIYNWINVSLLLAIIALFVYDKYNAIDFNWGVRFSYMAGGIFGSLLLIPIHEYLHALAYKYLGATRTSFDANLKKLYFMAIADQFVMDRNEFRIVAMTPFAVISFLCLVLFIFSTDLWTYAILGMLLTHTLFCSGDFALLNYFEIYKDKELVTYDDKSERMSYFYEKTADSESESNI